MTRNIYLCMLIFDTIKLISLLVIGIFLQSNYDLKLISEVSFKLMAYIQTNLKATRAWLQHIERSINLFKLNWTV